MNFREKLKSVIEFLGLQKKFESNSLSKEEFQTLVAEYQKKYQTTVEDDLAAEQAARATAKEQTKMQETLNQIQSVLTEGNSEEKKGAVNTPSSNASQESILAAINGMKEELQTLRNMPQPDVPEQHVNVSPLTINGFATTSKYLFGVEHPLFEMTKRWNKIANNVNIVNTLGDPNSNDAHNFHQEMASYAASLKNRYQFLQKNKMLQASELEKGRYATNYDGVDKAGLGDQFVTLRQDALIARVLQIRDVTQYFPVAYGYQDRSLVFNAFFDEVSQAYQPGNVFKGGMKIENQMGYVDDAMIKMEWGPMKELERKYIAYLNKEGSDPIKWSMIEFQVLNSLLNAQREQNKRRILGIYVAPEKGVAGSYKNASTGLLYTLLRYVHQYDLKPCDNAAYNSYSEATMLPAVQEYLADVRSSISEDMDIDNHVLYLNKNHQSWWIKNVRATYGKDTDFTGVSGALNVVPDTTTRIIWLPYLGQITFMMLQEPGNIQFLENLPGEMMALQMQQNMEQVIAWSTWKEGCSASYTGRRFDSKDQMDENDFEWQQIFINKFSTPIADAPDANNGFWFVSDSKTSADTYTDIKNAKAGVAYCIECGVKEHLPKIEKSGKFANISSAFTASKVGDYLMVILGQDGNFRELERCVAGKRTINKELQPNVPGGR